MPQPPANEELADHIRRGDGDTQLQREDDAQQVRGALIELPAEQRQVIELAYYGGFTHSEIAGMLDLPTGTVKGRMRLGLTKLRLSLADLAEAVA